MNPFILWLFFTLDKVGHTSNIFMTLSIIALIVIFITWLIICCSAADGGYNNFVFEEFWKCSASFYKRMKGWIILASTITVLTTLCSTFLPNTKEAVAIVVIPKVLNYAKNNESMMKIPNNVVNMANKFMEKKISEWSVSIGKDTVATDTAVTQSLDSQLIKAENLLKELKDTKSKVDKVFK